MARSQQSPRKQASGSQVGRTVGARETAGVAKEESVENSLPWFARTRGYAILALFTALIAWLASAELVRDKITLLADPTAKTSCDFNAFISCSSVMEHWQSEVFGFPNPLIGLVLFPIVITIAMALFAGARFARWYWVGIQVGITLGMIFIVWLWSQALYSIFILCPWCMVVWAMMIPLFVLTTSRNIIRGIIPAPAGLRTFLSNWAMLVVVALWLLTAASVLIRFFPMFFGSAA